MRLEDLTIALRPRQPWEAVDLGCTLVRRDYGTVLALWMITVLPIWTLMAILLWEHPFWFGAIAWWLKPLYDRVPLFYLSRVAFGARLTIKQTLREWPRLWSRFLFSALLLHRLSFIRSFALPVLMLEGQRGGAANKRVKALATDGGSSGASLTWVFVKLEIVAWLGLIALVSSIGHEATLPNFGEIMQNPEAFLETTPAQQWFSNLIYLAAMTLIEPFYVGAGFGLYLNSRTKIEGWDIELTFRRLAERLKSLTVVLITLGFFFSPLLQAQENADQTQSVETTLKDILDQPDFKEHSRTQQVWVSSEKKENNSRKGGAEAVPVVGLIFYGLAVSALLFLITLATRWLIQNKHLFKGGPARVRTSEPPPRVVMGLDIARESLPEDVVTAARQAWSRENWREALSLLYRGSLSRLVEHKRLPIRDSDTEDDCLMHVANIGEAHITDFFRQLTVIWVRAAYAGIEAQESEFDALCRNWPFQSGPVMHKPQRLFTTAVTLLIILPWMAGCDGHWEDVTIPLGYRGKARLDPFLAAEQLLQSYDHEAERLPLLKDFPYAEEGVIILSAESGMPEGRAQQLLDWVQEGGHLIYAMAGCAPYNDWGMFSSLTTFAYAGNEERKDPILEHLGVEAESLKSMAEHLKKEKKDKAESESESEEDSSTSSDAKTKAIKEPEDVPLSRSTIKIEDETYHVDFPDLLRLTLKRDLRWGEYAAESKDKTMALSLLYGSGRVTLLNHARPLRNRYIDENDHARWLLAMIGDEPRHVQFIVSMQQSFWSLLWKRAWMPLIGLALVILIWLWMNLPRFGPLQQVELHETRHFVDHIGALGQFFHRLRRPDILLSAAADAVRARAFRTHPHLAHRSDDALVDLLVQQSDIPKERIQAALAPSQKTASHEVVRLLQDLQKLKTALG